MEKKNKRIFNLPHNLNYELVSSYYTGGFEGEGYCSCDNCNALISRVAVLHDNNGKQYQVGFDCAKTLSSLNKEDIEGELKLFKYGDSIRKSILAKLKSSSISKVSIVENSNNWNIRLDSDNTYRNGYSTWINKDNLAQTHTLPLLNDLVGSYIYNKRVEPEFIEELKLMLKPGMQTFGAYKQSIVSIDFENETCVMRNDYMENQTSEVGTSKDTLGSVLSAMFQSIPEITNKLKEKGIL